jgi:integrase
MKLHITEFALKKIDVPSGKPYVLVHDQEQTGFAVHKTARGVMSYLLIYRDAQGKQRQAKLADVGPVSAHVARNMARDMLKTIAAGRTETATRKPRAALSPVMDDFFYGTYLPLVKASNRAQETYESLYRNHVQPFFGKKRMSDIGENDMLQYYADLKNKEVAGGRWAAKAGQKIKEGTVKRIMIFVRHVYNVAISDKKNVVGENPTKPIQLKMNRNIKGRFLTKEQLQTLVKAAKESENCDLPEIIQIMAGTALRRENVLAMRWEWLDLSNGALTVPSTADKAKQGFTLYLSTGVLGLLIARRNAVTEGDWVFPNPKTGRPYWSCRAAWVKTCERADLKGLRMHDLRHTFASLMLDSGADIVDVQKQLGHTQIKTTCIYLHLRQERKREKANAAEAASGIFM